MNSNFVIYSSSAGSGKTFQLAVKFISICLKGNENTFKEILAITFTNKAAGEMKSRILTNLYKLSIDDQSEYFRPFKEEIIKETKLNSEEITEKSKKTLSALLHDFSAFQVLTIDKFFIKVFKSFAADLLISPTRKPSIDEKYLKGLAFDLIINRIGTDSDFNEFFNTYLDNYFNETNQKNQKDIDPSKNLINIIDKISKDSSDELLFNLKDISYSDFENIINHLKEKRNVLEFKVKFLNDQIKQLFINNNITKESTSRGTLYNLFFETLSKSNLDTKLCLEKVDKVRSNSINNYFIKKEINRIINFESIKEFINIRLDEIKIGLVHINFLENIIKSSSLLIILRDVHREIQSLSEEENIVLLNDISRIIHENIKQERGDFIFEKVGMRYKHIFIDEFQDTSTRQWENLKPLIKEILSTNGTVQIIGDPKQSIYGFRNANSSQMVDLIKERFNSALMPARPSKISLSKNYRSAKTIVEFNNEIFIQIRERLKPLLDDIYFDIYQEAIIDKGGYVEIRRFDKDLYNENTLKYIAEIIRNKIENGFQMKDIAILTRSSENAKFLANGLINYQFDDSFYIQVTSSDSFLLKDNILVKIIINSIRVIHNEKDHKSAVNLLYDLLLENLIECNDSEHLIFKNYMAGNQNIFEYIGSHLTNKKEYDKNESKYFEKIRYLKSLTIDELVKHISKFYSIDLRSDVFLSSFIDLVYEFSNTFKSRDLGSFLNYWDHILSDELTINTSSKSDAVQVMTIHKAKGLEWPVVILPFCEFKTFSYVEEIIETDAIDYGLKTALVHITKNDEWPENYEPIRTKVIDNQLSEMINLLYVAMTRGKDEIYISYQKNPKEDQISHLLDSVLSEIFAENGNEDTISVGKATESKSSNQIDSEENTVIKTATTEWRSMLTIAPVYSALNHEKIAQGSKMHSLISTCYSIQDFEKKLSTLKPDNELYKLFKNLVECIRNSETLRDFFNSEKVMNERPITELGHFLVPDAIALNGNTIHILEYKTGRKRSEQQEQLRSYLNLVKDAGYTAGRSFLVYIGDEDVELVEVFD